MLHRPVVAVVADEALREQRKSSRAPAHGNRQLDRADLGRVSTGTLTVHLLLFLGTYEEEHDGLSILPVT
jgi:hypothetical protein